MHLLTGSTAARRGHPERTPALRSITDVRCRCGHLVTEHSAEGEYAGHPGMICEAGDCSCEDFQGVYLDHEARS